MVLFEDKTMAPDDYVEKKSCKKETTNFVERIDIDLTLPMIPTLPKNPLEIFEVVEKVMTYIGSEDLLKCRKVCRLWDEAVVRMLTSTPEQRVFCGEDFIETKRLNMEPDALIQFSILLKESKWPNLLWKNVSISSFTSRSHDYKAYPIDRPEFLKMFKDFGMYVKNLQILDRNSFRLLNKCLGRSGFCPNVQVLDIQACSDSSCLKMGPTGKLKLKKLILKDSNMYCYHECIGIEAVLDGILKSSPEINSLSIFKKGLIATAPSCLEILRKKPNFTLNLTELIIDGDIFDNWNEFFQIQFSERLKTVKLFNISYSEESPTSNEKKSERLTMFLKMVGKSLQTFVLEDLDAPSYLDVHCLPFMPKLKELSYQTMDSSEEYFDILKKFPVLRVLHLPFVENLHTFLEHYLKRKNTLMTPGTLNYVPTLVHKHLERIEIIDSFFTVFSPCTIQILNAVFPNYKEISIQPRPIDVGEIWVEGQQIWWEGFLQAISEMKNLRNLQIHFCDMKYSELLGIIDLTKAFSYLKASQRLEVLSFYGYDKENPYYKFLLQNLLAVIGANRLRLIELPEFPVKDINEETRLTMIKQFKEGNITLKIGGSTL